MGGLRLLGVEMKPMTPEERQALREKHSMRYEGYEGPHVCRGCGNHRARVPYPCDAIKILDAWDKKKEEARESEHLLEGCSPSQFSDGYILAMSNWFDEDD